MSTLLESQILPGERLSETHQAQVLETFYRDGVALIPGVLTASEVQAIRDVTDRAMDSAGTPKHLIEPVYNTPVFRYTQSAHRLFCDMLVREPFVSLADAILGPNAGFCGQNVIRGGKGSGISLWHIDDLLESPLPPEIPRHDARIRMPVFWFSFQIALSDIDSVEHGPTQYVPTSHYSGRGVPSQKEEELVFEDKRPIPVLCKAGDVYLFNHQTWHRGSVNHSDRPRYLMQNQYCKAWALNRFALKQNACALSDEELAGASPRLMQMLRRS